MLNSVVSGDDAQTVYNKMNVIDTSMASDFETQVEASVNDISDSSSKALFETSGHVDLSKIKLALPKGSDINSKSLLGSNWNWNTVEWYIGLCATTTAGLVMYRYIQPWFPWVGWMHWLGLGTAVGSTVAMCAQLCLWASNTAEGNYLIQLGEKYWPLYNAIMSSNSGSGKLAAINTVVDVLNNPSPLWQQFIVNVLSASIARAGSSYSFLDFSGDAAKFIINSNSYGLKILSVSSSTAVPVAYCYSQCPELILAIGGAIKSAMNTLFGIIPSWITITVNGVALKPL